MASAKPTDIHAAQRSLRKNFDILVESSIDPFALARKLDTAELLPEQVCLTVMDVNTGMTSQRRMEILLNSLRAAVKSDGRVFDKFLDIIKEVGGRVIGNGHAASLMEDYEGIVMCDKSRGMIRKYIAILRNLIFIIKFHCSQYLIV